MADMMFFMQKNKEKEAVKQKERAEKAKLKDVLITDTAETDIRKVQHSQAKAWDSTKRQTKSDLKDVNMAVPCFETEVRKEQHGQAKAWDSTKRQTKADLKDVNMAKAVFG